MVLQFPDVWRNKDPADVRDEGGALEHMAGELDQTACSLCKGLPASWAATSVKRGRDETRCRDETRVRDEIGALMRRRAVMRTGAGMRPGAEMRPGGAVRTGAEMRTRPVMRTGLVMRTGAGMMYYTPASSPINGVSFPPGSAWLS